MTLLYQFVSTAIIGFASTTLDMEFVLPSSTLKLFSSENTTLDRIMTETEQSFMGSISSASTLLVTPFCGYLLDTIGRKRSLILFFIPQLLSWLVIVTIFRVDAFIFAMFLCGLSGGMFLVAFVYVTELCDPSIRGGMSSTIVIFHGFGQLLSYLLGGLLEYKTMVYTDLTFTVVGLVLVFCLKESPMYLMKKGMEEEAAQSIAFFKGTKSNSEEVINEMENIRRLINFDVEIRTSPEEKRFEPKENKFKETLSIRKFFIKSRSSRRALIIMVVIFTLTIFQGLIVVQIYAGPFFESAVPGITANLTTVLFAIVSIVASCCGGYLSDKIGRRTLLIIASIATGFFCVIVATNIQFHWASSLWTAVLIYVYTFTYVVGAGTMPYVLLGEVFLPEIWASLWICMTAIHIILCEELGVRKLVTRWVLRRLVLIGVSLLYNGSIEEAQMQFRILYLVINDGFIHMSPKENINRLFGSTKIKGFATALCTEWGFLCNFIMLYLFIPLFNSYGLGSLFYCFGGLSFLTAMFSFIYLPETKSLPADVIQQKFLKRIKY